MVLREADVFPLPETPSFTSSMIHQSREKLQKCANEFSNPEQLEYNPTEYFPRKTQCPRASLVVLCKERLVACQFTLQGRYWIR